MALLSIDLGGTKLAAAVFSAEGLLHYEETVLLDHRQGRAVGALILKQVHQFLNTAQAAGDPLSAIGVSVPGICLGDEGVVWAPNIPGWDAYPLYEEIKSLVPDLPLIIDSDRACSLMGEKWQGRAQGCTDAVFLAVGTGIGAGIMAGGQLIRGAHHSAGAIGWMALERPYREKYTACGCFETGASGEGIAGRMRELLLHTETYKGALRNFYPEHLTAYHVFDAYAAGDELARQVIGEAIELWGMAVANLVSLFDPQIIVLGGGVFGPAVSFIPAIRVEACKWAQPISMSKVVIEASALGSRAALYGAAYGALTKLSTAHV
jgi:glucokinase